MDECFTNDDIKAVLNQPWVYYGAPFPISRRCSLPPRPTRL